MHRKLSLSFLTTSRGTLAAVWSEGGLYELTFPFATAELARSRLTHRENLQTEMSEAQQAWHQRLQTEMAGYFSGRTTHFTVPVGWADYPDFRRRVLQMAAGISYGHQESYGQVAAAVGSPGAARAVGGAMHANRTPLVVPCHRVVGADGGLTGFGGGLALKRELLELELK